MSSTIEAPPKALPAPLRNVVFTHSPSLDGLRAIAVLLVVIEHGSVRFLPQNLWLVFGRIGVGIFFVLSGYLITSLLLSERANRGRISLRDFYVRRALRIWPLYYAVLLLQIVALLHVSSQAWGGVWVSTDSPKYEAFTQVWWSYLVFVQNYFSDVHHHVSLALGVYWSLAIEEQYYLVWPLVLIALSRVRWRWTIPAFLVGAIMMSLLLRALTIGGYLGATGGGIERMTHTNIFGLAVGSLLAWTRWDRLQRGGPARGGGLFGATLAWIVLVALILRVTRPAMNAGWAMKLPYFDYYDPLLLSIVMAAIIDYVAWGGAAWSPLRWRPMTYIGRVSYGMYLLHPLVLGVALHALHSRGWGQVAIYMLATLGVAAASYELFEKRILRLKRRFSHVPSLGTEPPS